MKNFGLSHLEGGIDIIVEDGFITSDVMKDSISILVEKINKQKDDVLINRLKKLGIELDLKKEKDSRFKSLICETQECKETWWYKNGTESGVRVVTFVQGEQDFDSNDKNIISIELSYY